MPLSTEHYGYIVDPFFSFMDDKGKTIKNGFLRVFLAGSSTPAVTYLNWNGAMNQETIQLDNSGRCYTRVIGAKDSLYKVCVYDSHHSQETPIITVDNVQVISSAADVVDGSVTTQKIADEAVTAEKIRENAVTTLKIADEAVTESKLSAELKLKTIKDYVTPEMYGAKGDGSTDDTVSIQEAFDSGRPVFFDKKTYLVSSAIHLGAGSIAFGCGETSVIKMNDSVEISKVFKTNRNGNDNDIEIFGLKFRANALASTDDESGLVAIELVTSTNVKIHDCFFTGFHKNIECTECSNIDICCNRIYDAMQMTSNKINGYGILFESCDYANVADNFMTDIERHGIYCNGLRFSTVVNNRIIGKPTNKGAGYEGNIKVNGCKNLVIEGNILEGNGFGISLQKSFSDDPTVISLYNIKICNNIIKDCLKSEGFRRGLICCPEDGIYNDVSIEGNILTMTNVPAVDYIMDGILLDHGTFNGLSVRNNLIRRCSYGVKIDRETPIVFDGNCVEECSTGYEFTGSLKLQGDRNYYKDCTNPLTGTISTFRYSNLKEMVDLNNVSHVVTSSTVNANLGNLFEIRATNPQQIKSIANGFSGQEITILGYGVGSMTAVVADMDSLTKLSTDGDYSSSSYGILRFKKIDTIWYEIGRKNF